MAQKIIVIAMLCTVVGAANSAVAGGCVVLGREVSAKETQDFSERDGEMLDIGALNRDHETASADSCSVSAVKAEPFDMQPMPPALN